MHGPLNVKYSEFFNKKTPKATKTSQLTRMLGNPVRSRACHAGWPTATSGICIVGIPPWPKCITRPAKFSYSCGNLRGTSTRRILLTTNWLDPTARLPTLRFGLLLHEYRGNSILRNVSTRLSNPTQNIPGDINFQINLDCKFLYFLLKLCFNRIYSITLYTPDGPFLADSSSHMPLCIPVTYSCYTLYQTLLQCLSLKRFMVLINAYL